MLGKQRSGYERKEKFVSIEYEMNWETVSWVLECEPLIGGIFTYFQHSNLAGKVIVLFLVLFSLIAWTVMIGKYLDLSRLRSLNRGLDRRLGKVESIVGLDPRFRSTAIGPYATLLKEALGAYHRSDASSSARIGYVENALQRGVAEVTIEYEKRMALLGSIVTGAPFLGLLGTVWGVMDAFGSIAMESSASIQILAPGVSGALLTTVAGLLVAIPSVFGYNFLLTLTKLMITEIENFASSLADRFEYEDSSRSDLSRHAGIK